MTVLVRDVEKNEPLQRFGGAQLPSTLGESFRAAITDPRLRPTEMLGTQLEIEQERGETTTRDLLSFGFPMLGGLPQILFPDRSETEILSEVVPAEKLNEEYKALGLSFDRPTRRRVAEILAEQKKADLIRQDVLARSPGGLTGTGTILTASLAGAAIDPLNIASAFIPVVRETRYAAWAARVGPTTARVARGTVEGVVGNALVEPAVFGLSRQQQLDYTMADALLNIGLGGLLGGGLHAVGGRFGDFLSRQPPEVREAALRGSVAQVAQGKAVDVTSILDPHSVRGQLLSSTTIGRRPEVEIPGVGRPTSQVAAPTFEALPAPAKQDSFVSVPETTRKGTVKTFKTEDAATKVATRRQGAQAVPVGDEFGVLRRTAAEPLREPDGRVRLFNSKRDAEKAIKREGLDAERHTAVSFGPPGEQKITVLRDADKETLSAINRHPESVRIPDIERARFTPEGGGLPRQIELREVVRRETMPERDSAADFRASERVDEIIETDEDARGLAEQAAEDIDLLRASGDLDDDLAAQLGIVDEFDATTEGWTRAVRQAGHCLT